MRTNLQNRPDLYENRPALGPVLVPEGVYEARLVDVQPFDNAHGQRVALIYELGDGDRVTVSAAISGRGKLADLVAGMGEVGGLSVEGLRRLIGTRCRVRVVHGCTRAGTPYAAITETFRATR
jgi:hypothetical protein